MDVLSCHSYAAGAEAFRADLTGTRNQAQAAGKPWIVSECCNPAAGSTYEMVMPVLRELGVGHTIWQLVIGRDQFRSASGLVYPDGTVRRISQIAAVMNAPAHGFCEKPDEEGVPFQHDIPVIQAEYFAACLHDGVTETTWRERVTLIESLVNLPGVAIPDVQAARDAAAAARKAYDAGDHPSAFAIVAELIKKAAAPSQANLPHPAPPATHRATIYPDVYGVPHIVADTEEAAAYAIAWAQCEDMGMQVFDNLRTGVGRLAEVLGESALENDRLMHLWQVPETAQRIWQASPPRTKRYLQAFCDGLNEYRRAHADECQRALEADPMQVIALFRWTDVLPSHGIVQLCANTGLKQPPPPLDYPHQSSTWILGPSRTASRRPIVFIDPHWPAEGQTSWWEFHVRAGRMQAGGFGLPGIPLVGLGYTNGVAWAATAGGADSADVFELKINPENLDQYWYDGQWRNLAIREIRISVKKADGTLAEQSFRFRESVHGPVVAEQDGRVLAGAICGVQDTLRLEQWLAMNRAQSSEELRNALRLDQANWLNLTLRYAGRTRRLYPNGHVPDSRQRPVPNGRCGRRNPIENELARTRSIRRLASGPRSR